MFSTITTGSIHGISAILTQVEVDIARTMPAFDMVGMLSGEVKEARERVRVALRNSGIALPPVHITVNISPANIRKEGTAYDLPIAVGILVSLGHIPAEYVRDVCIIGELGLNGEVKAVKGVLPIVREAKNQGIKVCILPMENAMEGAVIEGIRVIGVEDFLQVADYFSVKDNMAVPEASVNIEQLFKNNEAEDEDFEDIVGQEACKRAALIVAAGFHHMALSGPPSAGKTMIARRIPGILPPLTLEESLEVSAIYSVSGLLDSHRCLITSRPFLSPHHTTTAATLAGGGNIPKPGLFSLSHRGVLFLDELPEFSRECIEVMRQPLEEKKIQISRTQGTYSYPADELHKHKKRGISYYSIGDEEYPNRLRMIEDRPNGLFVRGSLPAENQLVISSVGTRKHSYYGEKYTGQFASMLAERGIPIVSGMARGIDGIAQQTAIACGGKTYAVLGCGVDICYPQEHKKLYNQILLNGGIISEYPPGTMPAPGLFPMRNRDDLVDHALHHQLLNHKK